jgi:hypothetical protein
VTDGISELTDWRSERGSATVEVVFLMVLVLLPLLYLVGSVGRLQAGAYAASAAAREAGRAYVTAVDVESAAGRGVAAADLVFQAHGFGTGQGTVRVGCAAQPCLAPGGQISVDAAVEVPVPLVPDFMAGVVPTSVTMTSRHVEAVDRFREG